MPTASCTFRKSDVRRAIEAATAAGIVIASIEFGADGRIILSANDDARETDDGNENEVVLNG